MFEKRYKSHHDVGNVLSKYAKKEPATEKDFLNLLEQENVSKQLGLYLHTPYCDKICSFCNMNRKKVDTELEEYHQYLCQQIEYYGQFPFCQSGDLDVVFFGEELLLFILIVNYKIFYNVYKKTSIFPLPMR